MRFTYKGYELIFRKIPVRPIQTPKKRKKEPKPKIQKCIVHGKRMFTREQAALEAKATKNPQIRIYCCEFCQMWHLTHKKHYNTY